VPQFSLSAVGADRPGIVAAVSGVLVESGCNIEDSTMSILQGQFAILLVVSAPDTVTAAALELALRPVGERFGLMAMVRSIEDAGDGSDGGPGEGSGSEGGSPDPGGTGGLEGWTISVHGADRTGIVHGVASALAAVGGNVVDLTTHLVGEPGAPVYVMTLRATLPAGAVGESAVADVRRSAERLGVHCNVKRDDAELF
jgi:glycine cleavage system transcriptional repressor